MDFISAKFIIIAVVLFFLFIYWVFNFIVLYHLTRFGVGTQPKKFAAVFLLGSVVLFVMSALLLNNVDLKKINEIDIRTVYTIK
jgi:hypothetical protein